VSSFLPLKNRANTKHCHSSYFADSNIFCSSKSLSVLCKLITLSWNWFLNEMSNCVLSVWRGGPPSCCPAHGPLARAPGGQNWNDQTHHQELTGQGAPHFLSKKKVLRTVVLFSIEFWSCSRRQKEYIWGCKLSFPFLKGFIQIKDGRIFLYRKLNFQDGGEWNQPGVRGWSYNKDGWVSN